MVFSEEVIKLLHVIKFFRQNKHYGAKRFLKEFPHKRWSRIGFNKNIRKIDHTGTSKRLPGSGRPHTAGTADKIEEVETLVFEPERFAAKTPYSQTNCSGSWYISTFR